MLNWIKHRIHLTPSRMLTKLLDDAERSRIERAASAEFSLAMVKMLEARIAWVKTELAALQPKTENLSPGSMVLVRPPGFEEPNSVPGTTKTLYHMGHAVESVFKPADAS